MVENEVNSQNINLIDVFDGAHANHYLRFNENPDFVGYAARRSAERVRAAAVPESVGRGEQE